MLGYLSTDIICSEKRTVFRERSSRKTVSFKEQIMSKDKLSEHTIGPNGGYCVHYISNLPKTNLQYSSFAEQELAHPKTE